LQCQHTGPPTCRYTCAHKTCSRCAGARVGVTPHNNTIMPIALLKLITTQESRHKLATSRIEARQRLNKQVPVSPSHNESATDGSTHGKHTKGKRQSHRGTHTRRPNAAHAQTQSRPRGPRLRLHLPGTSVYDAQTLTQSQSLTHTNTRA